MTKWRVCGEWDLDVDVVKPARATTGDRPYHELPVASMGRRIVCRAALIRRAAPADRIVELFAGLGLSSTVYRGVHAPSEHVAYDLDPALAAHLCRNGFDGRCGDSFVAVRDLVAADLVDADFGIFTINRWAKDEKLRRFTGALFGYGHRQVILTDHAVSRFGAHRALYGRVLATDLAAFPDYLSAWSRLFHRLYGYSIAAVEYHRGSAYTLWQPVPPASILPIRTAADRPGVEVLQ